MKYALLAAIATLGISSGAQAIGIPPAASRSQIFSTDGCENALRRTADRPDEPFACCSRELGCAQFLATTRVEMHRHTPHT